MKKPMNGHGARKKIYCQCVFSDKNVINIYSYVSIVLKKENEYIGDSMGFIHGKRRIHCSKLHVGH